MSTQPRGYEETVICPYNKSHVILRHRIQYHLVRCSRSYPDVKLELCPFDVTHRIRKKDLKAHTENCPARESFDRFVYSVATNGAPPSNPPPKQQNKPDDDDDEECWDHYCTPTYDPQLYAQNAQVLRNSVMMTPSERRQFADAERKRLSELSRQ